MYSINILAGRLGQDINLDHARSTPACTLIVSEIRGTRDVKGEWKKKTVWHMMTAWGNLAEQAAKVLQEGSLCLFHYRIDYIEEKVVQVDGTVIETPFPMLKLTGFDVLADRAMTHDPA